MDDALRPVVTDSLTTKFEAVLILILMDDALRLKVTVYRYGQASGS